MRRDTFKERDSTDQPRQRARSWESCLPSRLGCSTSRAVADVGIELFHTLHKLTNADALGFLQNVRDVVPLLLSRVVGEHGEKVEGHTVFK